MTGYIKTPWATSGDKTAIPDPTQGSGSVSWNEGFGSDYQLADGDPDAKDIGRDTFNELHSVETTQIQKYQQFGIPDYITAAENGGAPFPYSFGVRVRDSGTGIFYDSLVGSNTALLSDTSSWAVYDAATTAFRGALVFANSPDAAPATTSELAFQNEEYDTSSIHDPGQNTRLTVPANTEVVKLVINLDITYVASITSATISVIKNGSYVIGLPQSSVNSGSKTVDSVQAVSAGMPVVPGDYFEVRIQNSDATNFLVMNASATWFSMEVIK